MAAAAAAAAPAPTGDAAMPLAARSPDRPCCWGEAAAIAPRALMCGGAAGWGLVVREVGFELQASDPPELALLAGEEVRLPRTPLLAPRAGFALPSARATGGEVDCASLLGLAPLACAAAAAACLEASSLSMAGACLST